MLSSLRQQRAGRWRLGISDANALADWKFAASLSTANSLGGAPFKRKDMCSARADPAEADAREDELQQSVEQIHPGLLADGTSSAALADEVGALHPHPPSRRAPR